MSSKANLLLPQLLNMQLLFYSKSIACGHARSAFKGMKNTVNVLHNYANLAQRRKSVRKKKPAKYNVCGSLTGQHSIDNCHVTSESNEMKYEAQTMTTFQLDK